MPTDTSAATASSTAAPCQATRSLWRAPVVASMTAAIHAIARTPNEMARQRADDGPDPARAAPAVQTAPAPSSQAARGHDGSTGDPPPGAPSRPTPLASHATTKGHACGSNRPAGTPATSVAAGTHTASRPAARQRDSRPAASSTATAATATSGATRTIDPPSSHDHPHAPAPTSNAVAVPTARLLGPDADAAAAARPVMGVSTPGWPPPP